MYLLISEHSNWTIWYRLKSPNKSDWYHMQLLYTRRIGFMLLLGCAMTRMDPPRCMSPSCIYWMIWMKYNGSVPNNISVLVSRFLFCALHLATIQLLIYPILPLARRTWFCPNYFKRAYSSFGIFLISPSQNYRHGLRRDRDQSMVWLCEGWLLCVYPFYNW